MRVEEADKQANVSTILFWRPVASTSNRACERPDKARARLRHNNELDAIVSLALHLLLFTTREASQYRSLKGILC